MRSACTCDLGSYKFYYYIEKDKSTYKPEDNDSELLWKFQTEPNEQIILKIGLSSVSAEEAEANLKKSARISLSNRYAPMHVLPGKIYWDKYK